jgi:hypothetical protein
MMKCKGTNNRRNSRGALSESRRRLMVLAAVLATPSAAVISMPTIASAVSPAPSNCAWNVAGEWSGYQTTGTELGFDIRQKTDRIHGSATQSSPPATGHLVGHLRGDKISFVVTWSNGPIGKYVGTVSTGEMTGVTHQIGGDGQRFNWTVTGPGACES